MLGRPLTAFYEKEVIAVWTAVDEDSWCTVEELADICGSVHHFESEIEAQEDSCSMDPLFVDWPTRAETS